MSNPFFVSPADVHLVLNQIPSEITANALIRPQITVTVENSAGDIIDNFDDDLVVLEGISSVFSVAIQDTGIRGALAQPINGVSTFNSASINLTPGSYDLAAILLAPGGFHGGVLPLFPIVLLPADPLPPSEAQIISGPNQDVASASSSIINVLPPVISFARQPADMTAGATLSPAVVVNLTDAKGNLLATDNSSVILSIASGPASASIGGTLTVNAINGVAVFRDLSFDTAGTYTLTASSDGGDVISKTFTIRPGAIASLTFTQGPTNSTAGAPIAPSIVVTAYDAFGNLVSGNQPVTLSIASGPAGTALSGTRTVDLVNGVATFTNVSLTTAGSYTLKAATGPIAAISGGFSISASGPANLSFVQVPASIVAGQTASIVLQVTDQYGNIVQDPAGFISLFLYGPNGQAFLPPGNQQGPETFTYTPTKAGRYVYCRSSNGGEQSRPHVADL
jgi:hypothetical protein